MDSQAQTLATFVLNWNNAKATNYGKPVSSWPSPERKAAAMAALRAGVTSTT